VLRLAAHELQEQQEFQSKLAETIGREDARYEDLMQQVRSTEEKRRKVLERADTLGLGKETVNKASLVVWAI
jgi:cell division protein FtsL